MISDNHEDMKKAASKETASLVQNNKKKQKNLHN